MRRTSELIRSDRVQILKRVPLGKVIFQGSRLEGRLETFAEETSHVRGSMKTTSWKTTSRRYYLITAEAAQC